MKKIAVTGGSGACGTAVVELLLAEGYEVRVLDIKPPSIEGVEFMTLDLAEYEQVLAALDSIDAIVHLAADPEPDFDFTIGAQRFKNNTLACYNVFNAAAALGIKKIVWASSETVLGFPFADNEPQYLPVDEAHIAPQNSYAMSKVVCTKLADHMCELYGLQIIGLCFSNILYLDNHRDLYSKIPGYWSDIKSRIFNLWSYIDARDAARSVLLSLRADLPGNDSFIIAAADTIMNTPSAELAAEAFPNSPLNRPLEGFETMTAIGKAKRVLGFEPEYSWRDILDEA